MNRKLSDGVTTHTAGLVMLQGLPGSGKTTYAREMKGYRRVNMDDLRSMLDDGVFSERNERSVRSTRKSVIMSLLANGNYVVVDDTNYHPHHEEVMSEVADRMGVALEVFEMDTPLDECLKRNAGREGKERVPDKVITEMAGKRDFLRAREAAK